MLLCSVLVIAMGGAATLLWQIQQSEATHAAYGNVVGPPSLPGSYIDSVLASAGSPMVGNGALIEQQSRLTNIDDAFALGVFSAETSYGAAGVGINCRNPGSVSGGRCGNSSFKYYASYSEAIVDWFNLIRNNYVANGMTTVYAISGTYVGTSGAPVWASKVINSMQRYQSQTAPPPPPVTPTPTRESRHYDSDATGLLPSQGFSQDTQHIMPGSENRSEKEQQSQSESLPVTLRNGLVFGGLAIAFVVACLGVVLRRRKLTITTQELAEEQDSMGSLHIPSPYVPAFAGAAEAPEPAMASLSFNSMSLAPSTEDLGREAEQFVASHGQNMPIAPLFSLNSKGVVREPTTESLSPLATFSKGGGLLSRYRNAEALNEQQNGAKQVESDPRLVSLGDGRSQGF
ncbi:hypothetical protein KSX_24100 [Ktedonospora formicarum]|uniref:Mannosyl-glycoprotein endo-beta-N-acetylglucosamidase-like domain-containing protein n=1 Tax=Ktedonospora formicarum TaxID=2778364 RepID=A0A8J3MPW0_9CHLR|nr:hypothetical protein KSX_24100 [Ktedonospora formicarum]